MQNRWKSRERAKNISINARLKGKPHNFKGNMWWVINCQWLYFFFFSYECVFLLVWFFFSQIFTLRIINTRKYILYMKKQPWIKIKANIRSHMFARKKIEPVDFFVFDFYHDAICTNRWILCVYVCKLWVGAQDCICICVCTNLHERKIKKNKMMIN